MLYIAGEGICVGREVRLRKGREGVGPETGGVPTVGIPVRVELPQKSQ